MKKVSIGTTDAYNEEFETFQDSKLFKRLNDKFKIKPYYIQFKKLRTVTVTTSYLFNFFSILTSFFFAYSLLSSFLGAYVGAILSLSLLTTLEAFKRLILPIIFKNYFQFGKVSYCWGLIALILVSLSGGFSYNGGNVAIQTFTPEAKQVDTEAIKLYYSELIGSKAEQQKQLFKVKYKGKTTRTAQRSIEALQTEINGIRSQENAFLTDAITQNKKALGDSENIKYSNGFYFSLLALIFDLVIIISLAFLEYYDYRSLGEFGTIEGKNSTDTATVPSSKNNLGGGANNENKEVIKEVIKEVQVQVPIKKQCLNCSNDFEVTIPKKKYCSTSCRVKHWEAENNKTLSVPT